MSGTSQNLVIVGAGVAGVKLALALRRGGFEPPVVLLSQELHIPYDRPPLSKEVLKGEKALDDVRLATEEQLRAANIELRLGACATGVDRDGQRVLLDDGSYLDYGTLVIATGVVPRRLPMAAEMQRVHALSTADDCLNVKSWFETASSVVMVGAGFIGSEIAATARELGLAVTLIDVLDQPLARIAGPFVGERVAAMHTDRGVTVKMNTAVEEIIETETSLKIVTTAGEILETDVAVVGIGSIPAVDWLRGSGLEIGDGVYVDQHGRTEDPNIWAIGDIARIRDENGRSIRHQHWTSATEQADALARRLTGRAPSPIPPVEYVWSDLYGTRLQIFGTITEASVPEVLIDEGERFLIAYTEEGRLVAVLGMGVAGKIMRFRGPVAQGLLLDDVRMHA